MSEYWKSLPKKFCEICKCWFADNKASIQFHERGKNHQENVKKKINQIQKKGLKDYKAKVKLDSQMEKMEKAALAAYKKDLQQNPDLSAKHLSTSIKEEPQESFVPLPVKTEPTNKTKPAKCAKTKKFSGPKASKSDSAPKSAWYEATSEEGYTYYWNSVTSESVWESPEEGFISLQEQSEQEENSQKDFSEATHIKTEPVISEKASGSSMGPQLKPDPYGCWVSTEKKVEEPIDWQLPSKSENAVEVYIPVQKETFKIKEKVVEHLKEEFSTEDSVFKKRKNFCNAKRNVRQRISDE